MGVLHSDGEMMTMAHYPLPEERIWYIQRECVLIGSTGRFPSVRLRETHARRLEWIPTRGDVTPKTEPMLETVGVLLLFFLH